MGMDNFSAVEMQSAAEYVISKFGGLTGTAKAIGKPVTTVQGWKERGQIPQAHWNDLISAAQERGQRIELSDFLSDHPIFADRVAS